MIITLCGSARFERLFKAWNEALTMAGHTVFTLTAYPSDKAGVKQWYTDEQKAALDAAHLRKIDASDAIFVLNKHAYIGESTLREVDHARRLRRTIYFLESWGQGSGVGSNHTDEAQHAVIADGLTVPTASPIDTTTRTAGVRCPWASSLLGPAGPRRSAIVELTKAVALAAAPQPAATETQVEAVMKLVDEWSEADLLAAEDELSGGEVQETLRARADAARGALCRAICALITPPVEQPAASTVPALCQAARDVLEERARQTSAEGYAPEHDDEHWAGDLVRAAVSYAWPTYPSTYGDPKKEDGHQPYTWCPYLWPWDQSDWKPKGKRRNLVRAAALLIADIERLDRAAAKHGSSKEGSAAC